jgi:two-component system response regulator RegA
VLTESGFEVRHGRSLSDARLYLLHNAPPTHALVDLRLPDGSGLHVVQALRQASAATTIVVLTGFASIATAIEAIKLGACDYLCKPVSGKSIAAALLGCRECDAAKAPSAPTVPEVEHQHIQSVLEQFGSNISAAARALGMHRRTLQRKLSRPQGVS